MSDTPTITIDLDKKCSQCGQKGAANGGICLKCVAKRIRAPKETTVSPINAAPETLCVMATDVFAKDDKPHWSTASAILGRINDEALYGTDFFGKYATLEAYAKDLLELTKGEVGMALKLWRLIQRCEPHVAFDAWAGIKRARALLLIEVLDAGGDTAEWFTRCRTAPTTLDFEMEVRFFLKEQVWAWFKVKVPLELLGVIEEALVRAVEANPDIITAEAEDVRVGEALTSAEIAGDLRYRFQALEQVCLHYVQTVEAPQLELPTEPK